MSLSPDPQPQTLTHSQSLVLLEFLPHDLEESLACLQLEIRTRSHVGALISPSSP